MMGQSKAEKILRSISEELEGEMNFYADHDREYKQHA